MGAALPRGRDAESCNRERLGERNTHSTCICHMDTHTRFEYLPAMHAYGVRTWVVCVRFVLCGYNEEVCVCMYR